MRQRRSEFSTGGSVLGRMGFHLLSVVTLLVLSCGAPVTKTPDTPSTGSGRECATPTSSPPQCLGGCEEGEVCNTQVGCGPIGPCFYPTTQRDEADNRCHTLCQSDADCATGAHCEQRVIFRCLDGNNPSSICR